MEEYSSHNRSTRTNLNLRSMICKTAVSLPRVSIEVRNTIFININGGIIISNSLRVGTMSL